jgi:hypothetical protein
VAVAMTAHARAMTAALVKHPAAETETTTSMVPAIDQVITRLHGVGLIYQHDVVDLLLDLRLIAKTHDIVEARDAATTVQAHSVAR